MASMSTAAAARSPGSFWKIYPWVWLPLLALYTLMYWSEFNLVMAPIFALESVLPSALLGIIALVSAGSEVYRVRCPDNPIEWCEYNDSVPAMFALAAGYVLVAWIRAWTINTERG